MKKISIFILVLLFCLKLEGQELLSINSTYNDDLREWNIYIIDTLQEKDGDEIEGSLQLTWQDDPIWNEWDFRLGEISGDIKLRWRDDPEFWELRTDNQLVTARAIWKGDLTAWTISDGHTIVKFKSKWRNTLNEWQMMTKSYGEFYIYTSVNNDPRDWEIEDYTTEKITFPIKLMMSFIAVVNTTQVYR